MSSSIKLRFAPAAVAKLPVRPRANRRLVAVGDMVRPHEQRVMAGHASGGTLVIQLARLRVPEGAVIASAASVASVGAGAGLEVVRAVNRARHPEL